jgi:4-carboxymuconolactone decarboxylase
MSGCECKPDAKRERDSAKRTKQEVETLMMNNTGRIIQITVLSLILGTSLRLTAQDRMPPISTEKMTEEQKKAVGEFRAARKAELTGPWIALLRSPEVLTRARVLSDYLRFTSVLPPRLSEFVILMTARQWTQQYEWNAHYQIAMNAGLNSNIAKAIAEGHAGLNIWERMKRHFMTSASSSKPTRV